MVENTKKPTDGQKSDIKESITLEQNPTTNVEALDSKHYNYKEREHKDRSEDQELIIKELMQDVTKMEKNEDLRKEATEKANTIRSLGEEKKLVYLLDIAKAKGVTAALHAAQKTNDPYLLDLLHDILSKEGFYKKIKK